MNPTATAIQINQMATSLRMLPPLTSSAAGCSSGPPKNGIILLRSDNISIDGIEFFKIIEEMSYDGLAEELCAIVFSDGNTRHKAVLKPCAKMPAQELRSALQTIVSCLGSAR